VHDYFGIFNILDLYKIRMIYQNIILSMLYELLCPYNVVTIFHVRGKTKNESYLSKEFVNKLGNIAGLYFVNLYFKRIKGVFSCRYQIKTVKN